MQTSIFGTLEDLRNRPIPDQEVPRGRMKGCRRLPIARDTPHGNEPLVDIADFAIGGENYYHAHRNPPYWRRIEGSIPDLLLRRAVAEKLATVNARLAPIGLELFVFDGWRPRAVQRYFHDHWMPEELRKRDPALRGAALTEEIERYWAAPTEDASSPAPHETGGAVDLTIRWKDRDALWMGSLFDDAAAIAHRDRFERADAGLCFSDEEARANRRLLHWLMIEEGFTGHPNEWWHFSWGDQMWAALSGGTAHYGLAAPG